MLEKISTFLTRKKHANPSQASGAFRIIPRDQHSISRQQISRAALDVLYGLNKAGFQAFLVGGCLRDLLIGVSPKDFDVATDASPEQVVALFRRSRIIGRRFRIVHVRFGNEIIEVSTFRAMSDASTPDTRQHARSQTGLILRDNVFGSIEEDALRRDFTINALYYNIADFSLYEFANSLEDIQSRRLRLIGDPLTRYQEDPVRMLRAARFSAKLQFKLDAASEKPIRSHVQLLLQVSPARLYDEQLKLFLSGYAHRAYAELTRLGLFAILFPDVAPLLQGAQGSRWDAMIQAAMHNTDVRLNEGKHVTPAFLFAVLLWPAVSQPSQALAQTISRVLTRQIKVTAIPRRFTLMMREIWELQGALEKRKRPAELLAHPKFRAAFDFLQLRETAGLVSEQGLSQWWENLQNAAPEQRNGMIQPEARPSRRRRRRRKPAASS